MPVKPALGRPRERGYSLFITAVSATVMLSMLGITTDLGRMYVVKTEIQAFSDSSAIAAAYELNGTNAGLAAARSAGTSGPRAGTTLNRWNFGTQTVHAVQVKFATASNGPYMENPASGVGQRFVEVTASAAVPMYFLAILPGIGGNQTVSAGARAGQALTNTLGEGGAPFSPDAHDVNDPNFGFTIGQMQTIKWAPPGQRKHNSGRCPGDYLPFQPGGGSSDRGYIDVGQGNGNSSLHDAIVNNSYDLANPLTMGSYIDTVPGNKHVGPAVDERFNQDTDTTSGSYATYNGNGRRLLICPVNDGGDSGRVIGFGVFLLHSDSCGGNNDPCCAEYVGNAAVLGSKGKGGGVQRGLYVVQLVR